MSDRVTAARERVRAHRQRKREAGLRLVQYWVPDTCSPEWRESVRQQCLAANKAEDEADAQAFIDSHLDAWLQSAS